MNEAEQRRQNELRAQHDQLREQTKADSARKGREKAAEKAAEKARNNK